MRMFTLVLSTVLAAAPALMAPKSENWIEVRSPHFIVLTNGSEKQGRRVGDQFERVRSVFRAAFPGYITERPECRFFTEPLHADGHGSWLGSSTLRVLGAVRSLTVRRAVLVSRCTAGLVSQRLSRLGRLGDRKEVTHGST
jgi:hypothetical protein